MVRFVDVRGCAPFSSIMFSRYRYGKVLNFSAEFRTIEEEE